MSLVNNFKMAVLALVWVILNVALYYVMMEIDRQGGPKPLFILVRVVLMVSVIMQLLFALGILEVPKK